LNLKFWLQRLSSQPRQSHTDLTQPIHYIKAARPPIRTISSKIVSGHPRKGKEGQEGRK